MGRLRRRGGKEEIKRVWWGWRVMKGEWVKESNIRRRVCVRYDKKGVCCEVVPGLGEGKVTD